MTLNDFTKTKKEDGKLQYFAKTELGKNVLRVELNVKQTRQRHRYGWKYHVKKYVRERETNRYWRKY